MIKTVRPKTVLILHAGALGDCVLTLHLIRAMQAAWNQPAVTMAARSPIARWAYRRGLLAEARSLDDLGAHLLYQPDTDVPGQLVRFLQSLDRIVSFLGGPDDPVTVRLQTVCTGEVIAIDPRPTEVTLRAGRHITQQWARDLGHCGYPVSTEIEDCVVLVDHEKRVRQRNLIARLGAAAGRMALCHPGSGGLDKCCPIEALEEVVTNLVKNGWAVAWMIGPDEIERFGQDYTRRLEDSAPVIYEESVERAADLVCGADLFIGQDAGMTHLAALAGVRTVALFGPTDPRLWRPLASCCWVVRFPEPNRPIQQWITKIVLQAETCVPDG